MRDGLLITGGAGFIGSHLVNHFLETTDWDIIILDRLDRVANLDRLKGIDNPRVKLLWWDLRAQLTPSVLDKLAGVTYVIHAASMTHVDRSIKDPLTCVMDNVVGTCNLLEALKFSKLKLFIYTSTDEVLGSALSYSRHLSFKETDIPHPENAYSASKLGAEGLVIAYACTYKLPAIITRSVNVYGTHQYPEKFIPLTIRKVLAEDTVLIHANESRTISGSRFYLHISDLRRGIEFLIKRADLETISKEDRYSGIYHITDTNNEVSNLELAKAIASILGKPLRHELVDFHSERRGHDLRYSLDGSKMALLGYKPTCAFTPSLEEVVRWYVSNPNWLESV